jgi:hypothetical protein
MAHKEERYLVADDVVHRLQNGDPWRLLEELPSTIDKGHSTPPMNERSS